MNRAKLQLGIIGLLLINWPLTLASQDDKIYSYSDYEDFFKKAHEQGHFNGNALISKQGEIIYQGAFGISSLNPRDSLYLKSTFRLASVSKQFTAMAVMMLKERGLLTYDQDIGDFIPELPYQGITVRHLLNHTSGLPDYVNLMDNNWLPEYAVDNPKRLLSGNEDIINMLAKKSPEKIFQPGDKWEYSNTGYVMLATIVARVSEIPFEEFLKINVFDPSDMYESVVYNYTPDFDVNYPERVFGLKPNENNWVPNDCHYLNKAQGDGGIYSSIGDLLRWDRILYTDKLVHKETLSEAFVPGKLNNGASTQYGFGWFLDQSPSGGRVVEHGGGWVGFRTNIYRDIDEETCIILLTNDSSDHLAVISKSLKRMLY